LQFEILDAMIFLRKGFLTGLLLALLIGLSEKAEAQCAFDNTPSTFFNLTPPSIPGDTTQWCIDVGTYVTVAVDSGYWYTFSTCNTWFDSELTLYTADDSTLINYNNNYCGQQAAIFWQATFTDTVALMLNEFPCQKTTGNCAQLYVAVDTVAPPVIAGDCNGALPIISNTGFSVFPNGSGSIDEFNGNINAVSNPQTNPASANSGCLLAGELNSTWLLINIVSDGDLEFTLGDSDLLDFHCYDWIMWPYDTTTCVDIFNNTLSPIRCNWNGNCQGYTGIAAAPPNGGDPSNWEPPISVNCGDKFLICFSNYSSALTNVPIQFIGSASVGIENEMCVSAVSCPGACDGSILASTFVSGATDVILYDSNWNIITNKTPGDYEDLCSGDYNIIITDSTGQHIFDTIAVTVAPADTLVLSATVTNETFGNDGAIDLTVTGGNPPYSFQWDNGAGSGEDPSTLTGNATYTVIVTDANGCTDTLSAFVGSVVGLNDLSDGMQVSVFPNPNKGQFTLQLAGMEEEAGLLEVLNPLGQIVSTQQVFGNRNAVISLHNLEDGIYFLQVRFGDRKKVIRIIIQ
jgi:hypothetical protein